MAIMERMTNELFELLTKANTHDKKYFAVMYVLIIFLSTGTHCK